MLCWRLTTDHGHRRLGSCVPPGPAHVSCGLQTESRIATEYCITRGWNVTKSCGRSPWVLIESCSIEAYAVTQQLHILSRATKKKVVMPEITRADSLQNDDLSVELLLLQRHEEGYVVGGWPDNPEWASPPETWCGGHHEWIAGCPRQTCT